MTTQFGRSSKIGFPSRIGAQERDPGVRLVAQRVAVAVHVTDLGIARLAPARRMILGDHRKGGTIGLKTQLLHALPSQLADRVRRAWLLIAVLRELLRLTLYGSVESDQMFRLYVIGLKVVVS